MTAVLDSMNFNSQKNWSLQKHELQIGVGVTQFLGDLEVLLTLAKTIV